MQCQFECQSSNNLSLKFKKFKFCSKVMKICGANPLPAYLCALIMTFPSISFDEIIGNKATLNFVVSWYLKVVCQNLILENRWKIGELNY